MNRDRIAKLCDELLRLGVPLEAMEPVIKFLYEDRTERDYERMMEQLRKTHG